MNIKKIVIILFLFIFFFCTHMVSVYALEDVEIENIRVIEKTESVSIDDEILFDGNTITSPIVFQNLNDFVTFEIDLKNNTDMDLIFQNSSIQFDEDYLQAELESGQYIYSNGTSTISFKLRYANEVINQEEYIPSVKTTLSLSFAKSSLLTNPFTSNSLKIIFIIISSVLLGLGFILWRKKRSLFLLFLLLFPFFVKAEEGYFVNINFDNITIKGRLLSYNIIFKDDDSIVDSFQRQYGEEINELPDISRDGYTFNGWLDQDGNYVDSTFTVFEDIVLVPEFTPIVYTITYDNSGGVLSSENPTSYTVEDEFTLNNPTKEGYNFAGWKEENTEILQTIVTIYEGTTGNKSYIAVFSANPDTAYTVIHQQMDMDGNYQETERENLTGVTDTMVSPQPKNYDGFIIPEIQTKNIDGNGSTTFIYQYERKRFDFSITDRSNIDEATTVDGNYYFGTSITIVAKEIVGYHLEWNDGDQNYTRNITLSSNLTLTPNYLPNTNTRYTVIHKQMNLDGNGYTTKDTQYLEGTTGTEVTPTVNYYEGFTAPGTQTVTIKGDGTTEVIYNYERNKYLLTLMDSENIETTTPSGEYYYGTSITLKVKDKVGETFAGWTNNDTNQQITIIISGNITIGPIYTGNDNIPYTVIHQKQNITGTGYEEAEVENLTGRTGDEVTPNTKDYTGFTAPSTQTVIIRGDGSTEVIYQYRRNKYNLTLTDDEYIETTTLSGEYYYETSITLTAKDKEGFVFEKWSNGAVTESITFTIAEDTTIGPVYGKKSLVTFNPNGGTVDTEERIVNPREAIGELPIPTREEYYYAGWFINLLSGTSIDERYVPNGDIELFAKWKRSLAQANIENETIQINIGEEENINITNSYIIEETYTFTSSNPAIATVDENGKVTGIDVGTTTVVITGNKSGESKTITVEVIDNDPNSYRIIFNPNGGSVNPTFKKVPIGNAIGELPIPLDDSYMFGGWYSAESGGEEITSDYIPTGNIEIYARWFDYYIVAVMDGEGYYSIQEAVDEVPTNTEKTIKIVNDTSESFTVSENQEILFDLQNHTIEYDETVVTNDGKITITNGVITSSGSSGTINNNSHGTLTVTSGMIEATYDRQAIYNDGGTVTISGDAILQSYSDERAALQNKNNGTVNILGGQIISFGAYAVYNESGTLNIGEKDGNSGADSPVIQGITYGVIANSSYNFYDGIIKGVTYPFGIATTGNSPDVSEDTDGSKISEVEEGFEVLYDEEEQDYDTYITAYLEFSGTKNKITFNANGGEELTPNYKNVPQGHKIGKTPTPIRTGYYFVGWYTGVETGEEVTSNYIPLSDIEIFARWRKSVASMEFESSNITLGLHDEKQIVITNINEIDEEYTFSSLDTSIATVDSTGKVRDVEIGETKVVITGLTSGQTIEIIVVVDYPKYQITFDSNGGSDVQDISIYQTEPITNLPVSIRDHYFFAGWYTNLTEGIKIEVGYVPENDLTLHAKWVEAEYYTITFDPNGGVVDEENRVVSEDMAVGQLPTPTKENFYFAGWLDQEEGRYYTAISKPYKNVTLTAQWTTEQKIARINSNYYTSIQNAINAAVTGDEVVLLVDRTENPSNNKKIIMNLDFHTITGKFANNSSGDLSVLTGSIIGTTSSIYNVGTLSIGTEDVKVDDGVDLIVNPSSYSSAYGINGEDNNNKVTFNAGSITISGKSSVYGIYSGKVIMNGGTITLSGSSLYGIEAKNDATVNGGKIVINLSGSGYSYGVHSYGDIIVNNGEIKSSYGVYTTENKATIYNAKIDAVRGVVANDVEMYGGTINSSNKGIEASRSVKMYGGSINIDSSTSYYITGIECDNVMLMGGEINIKGKNVKGIASGSGNITMNGGTVTIIEENSSNTSQGLVGKDIVMNGGTIDLQQSIGNTYGIQVYEGTATMNQGTIILASQSYGIYLNGASLITINGGTFTKGDDSTTNYGRAITGDSNECIINGGLFDGIYTGIELGGKVTINNVSMRNVSSGFNLPYSDRLSLVMNDGIIEAKDTGIYAHVDGMKMEMNGGTIIAPYAIDVDSSDYYNGGNGSFIMNGGTLVSTNFAIQFEHTNFVMNDGIVIINGKSSISISAALSCYNGDNDQDVDVIMNGGQIITDSETTSYGIGVTYTAYNNPTNVHIIMNGGMVNASSRSTSYGISGDSNTLVTMNGGSVLSNSSQYSSYGIISNEVIMNGGAVSSYGNSDVYGINSYTQLTYNGGVTLANKETVLEYEDLVVPNGKNLVIENDSDDNTIAYLDGGAITITLNPEGGEVHPSTIQYMSGEKISLPIPEKEGYYFVGWYTQDGDFVDENTTATNNQTYYAHWKKSILNANLNSLDIHLDYKEKKYLEISADDVEEDYYIRSNNKSIVKADQDGCLTEVDEGQTTVSVIGLSSGKILTVNVTVSYTTYVVSFNANGGEEINSRYVVRTQSLGEILEPSHPDHYNFDGWYTSLTNGIKVDNNYVPTADITLFARWSEANSYTITFDANGGSVSSTSKTVYGDEGIGTLPTPTRDNYYFMGWLGEDQYYTDISKLTKDVTVVAQWASEDYVARIGSTYYPTLAKAVYSARNGDEVVLLKDTNENISNGYNITINLNKHVLTGLVTNAERRQLTLLNGTIQNAVLKLITNNGTLIIGSKDKKVSDGVNVTNSGDSTMNVTCGISNSGTLIFNKGNISVTNAYETISYVNAPNIYGVSGGTVIMNGGTISSNNPIYKVENHIVVCYATIYGISASNITINGGTISLYRYGGYGRGIKGSSSKNLFFYGGKIVSNLDSNTSSVTNYKSLVVPPGKELRKISNTNISWSLVDTAG